jgi:hypothetical protein
VVQVKLYTPEKSGWSPQDLTMTFLPNLGHWIHLRDEHLRVKAVVHTGWTVEVYAAPDDFGKVLGPEE